MVIWTLNIFFFLYFCVLSNIHCGCWLCFSDWLPHLGCFFFTTFQPSDPQGAEFNPECSGSDKTMAVTASIAAAAAAAAAATALSSSSSNGLNGIRTWYPRNNKGLGSKFQSSRVRDKPEEGRRIRRPKRCEKNNLDEEVSPKSIINENTSSQKYRQ